MLNNYTYKDNIKQIGETVSGANMFNIVDNQLPLKPVCPVIRIVLSFQNF